MLEWNGDGGDEVGKYRKHQSTFKPYKGVLRNTVDPQTTQV